MAFLSTSSSSLPLILTRHHNSTVVDLPLSSIVAAPSPQLHPPHGLSKHHMNRSLSSPAIADRAPQDLPPLHDVLLEDTDVADLQVAYNWEEEWYPLYLTEHVPRNAPLGLTVFDKKLVLHFDGNGTLRCYEDRCPHRLAKLSEGQIIDGRLECLYHGWQFEGDGQCAKIPQLAMGAKIPKASCVRSYLVQESQGVVWVWMADKSTADFGKLPHFQQYDHPNFKDYSTMNMLPYDHSILLENLLDPAHVPISHDRTDTSAKREKAQPLKFDILERSSRGFVGRYGESSSDTLPFLTRFEAPCIIRSEKEVSTKDGTKKSFAIFLCRPAGQGKSMVITRFCFITEKPIFPPIPKWLAHQVSNKVFEQDMGFLASQNEVLLQRGVPAGSLYLNLRSSDVFVMEYRKWLDKVGHGMPYYVGHKSLSPPPKPAVLEDAPAGFVAATASSQPTKGGLGIVFATNPTNRYFHHVVHCVFCRQALQNFKTGKQISFILSILFAGVGMAMSRTPLRIALVVAALLAATTSYLCQLGYEFLTTNEVRPHRR